MQARTNRRVMVAGIAAVAVYVLSALVSGTMSPLARRPLLDGSHAAVPYNWVSPPGDLAASNKEAQGIDRQSFKFGPEGLGQTLASTGDQQISINLPEGSVKPVKGKTAVEIIVEPQDPATRGLPPDGFVIRGNAYRVVLRYAPGGTPVGALVKAGNITLVYPSPTPELLGANHVLLYSSNGETWRKVEAQTQHATQQVVGKITDIGYFAVAAEDKADDPAKKKTKGKPFPWWVLIVIVVGVAVIAGVWLRFAKKREERRRREARRAALVRQSRSTKKRRR